MVQIFRLAVTLVFVGAVCSAAVADEEGRPPLTVPRQNPNLLQPLAVSSPMPASALMTDDDGEVVLLPPPDLTEFLTATDPEVKLASLENIGMAELEKALEEQRTRVEAMQDAIPLVRADIRETKARLRRDSDWGKEIRRKMAELEREYEEGVMQFPELQEKQVQLDQLQRNMQQELQLQQRIRRLIAQKTLDTTP